MATEIGSLEYTLNVKNNASADLEKIIREIQNIGQTMKDTAQSAKSGFSAVESAISNTEKTIRTSNDQTVQALGMLGTVMADVRNAVNRTNETLANNGKALEAIRENTEAMQGQAKATASAREETSLLGDAMKAAAGYFAVDKILEFSKSVVETRKNMQTLRVQFNTLLGDEKKAEGMFNELKEFATNTPLQMQDLADSAKMMLSFGIEENKILPFLKNLGDISMGDSQKLQSLTLAFSQMSSTGKLMGQDLLQMINAGFNPLSEIAKQTGKSIGQLKDEMSAGKISVEMVQNAFKAAASEGGKFYGMLEAQSKTMAGAIAKFEGAMNDFKNELGSAIEGPLVNAYNLGTKLLKNYEALATALEALVAAVGTYKAAMIAANGINAVSKVLASAKVYGSLAQAIKATAAAEKMLNMVRSVNVWAILAAGIAAATVALFKYNSEKERQRRLEEQLNEELAKQKGYASQEKENEVKDEVKVNVDLVFDNSGTKTATEQQLAYEKLIKKYGELKDKYKSLAEMQSADRSDINKIIALKDEKETVEALTASIDVWKQKQKEANDILSKPENFAFQGGERYFVKVQQDANDAAAQIKNITNRLEERRKAEENLKADMEARAAAEEELKKIEALKETVSDEEKSAKVRRQALEELKEITKDTQKELEKQVKAAEKAEEQKAKALEKERKAREKEERREKVSAFEQQMQNDIAAADRMIEKLNILTAARKKAEQDGGELGKEEIKSVDKAEATILRDAIKNNKQSRDEEKRYNKERMSENERYEAERKALLSERTQVEAQEASESKDRQLRIYDEMLAEMDQRHLNAVNQTYDKSVEEFGSYMQRLEAVDKEYQDRIDAARAKNDDETAQNLVIDRERQKVDVLNDYLSKLPAVGAAWGEMQDLSTEALKMIQQNLRDTGAEIAKNLTPEQIEALGKKLKEVGEQINSRSSLSFSKQLKEVSEAKNQLKASNKELKRLQDEGKANTKEWTDEIERNREATKRLQKAQDGFKKKLGEIGDAVGKMGSTIQKATSEMNESAQAAGNLINAMFDLVSEVCKGMEQTSRSVAEAIRDVETSSVILAIIDAIIAAVKAVVNALPDTSTAWESIADVLENFTNVLSETIDKEKELLKTMNGQEARESYDYINSQLQRQINAYKMAGLALVNYQKQHKNFLSDMFSADYTSNATKFFRTFRNNSNYLTSLMNSENGASLVDKYGMNSISFLSGGSWDDSKSAAQYKKFLQELILLDGEALGEIKRNSTVFWSGLDANLQAYLNAVIDAYDEMKEATFDYYEAITNVSFESVKDEFLDMISDMDVSAEDFANKFSEYMRNAMIKSAVFNSKEGIGGELEEWYKKFGESMESGGTLDSDEINYLNTKRDEIFEKAREMVEKVNGYFDLNGTQSALSGALSTASQQSIDLLAGQTNAVRQNQIEAINIMREQLTALLNLHSAAGVSNELLQSIDTRLANQNTGLRAWGITEIPE